MNTLGFDIGGTWIKIALLADGAILHEERRPTAAAYPALLAQLADLAAAHGRAQPLAAIGVGVAGFIDFQAGEIVKSPNLPWLDHARLERDLQALISLPLALENDANAAALGEYSAMAEPRPGSLVHLTLGTGIGSGIVLAGRVWRGERGFGGELGHVVVQPDGRPCGCGGNGCAETEAGETGIVASYRELGGPPGATDAAAVYARLGAGDEAAARAFARAGRFLGVLFADIANFLNPAVVTIGGGVAAAGEAILGPARAEFRRRVPAESFAATRIEAARLGNRAGAIGAAWLARDRAAA